MHIYFSLYVSKVFPSLNLKTVYTSSIIIYFCRNILSMDPLLEQYIIQHISKEPELLEKLNRAAHQDLLYPRMVSGHLQGRILSMLCHMSKPKRILELGTFAGYSALCMAEALSEGGELHTIEINDELEMFSDTFFEQSQDRDKIFTHIGDALEIVPTIPGFFDFVFIDANKRHYVDYYHLIIDRVPSGGYILADNILWDAKVVQDVASKDKQTQGIIAFNKMVQEDDRVENVILPIRDGMMLLRKL